VRIEIVGEELRQRGHHALAHLHLGNAERDRVVGRDCDPVVDLDGARLSARHKTEAETHTCADGHRGQNEGFA
jgi:hypothetical protein